MDSNLVRFVCRAKVHLEADGAAMGAIVSPVTINDGTWAYCPAGAGSDHDWEAIDPVSMADLKLIQEARPREAAAEDLRS